MTARSKSIGGPVYAICTGTHNIDAARAERRGHMAFVRMRIDRLDLALLDVDKACDRLT